MDVRSQAFKSTSRENNGNEDDEEMRPTGDLESQALLSTPNSGYFSRLALFGRHPRINNDRAAVQAQQCALASTLIAFPTLIGLGVMMMGINQSNIRIVAAGISILSLPLFCCCLAICCLGYTSLSCEPVESLPRVRLS